MRTQYGYGQWQAIRLAVRRNPLFRFDYFLRSLPFDQIGKRCEQLMKFAKQEVEHLEKQYREDHGLPTEPETEGAVLPPVELPTFRILQEERRKSLAGRNKESVRHAKAMEELHLSASRGI